ncbi:MAG: 16S rRNA (cytosine1402-N4)-methyltransferase [Candidatus Paceibacteria bacterium]|jgi:16S rRNA (cytosine1402-N4)-methyltransferase
MSDHIPVLMNEVIEGLDLSPGDIVIDGTINGGGHAHAIASRLDNTGVLVGIDQDKHGLAVSKERLKDVSPTVHLVHENSRNIESILDNLEIPGFDKLLLDLGWSSNQFEDPERGFSFRLDGPLLMTLSDDPKKASFTAQEIVNDWSEESLIDILIGYGEERFARRIAAAIVERRLESPITRTVELAELIKSTVPGKFRNGALHPATLSFQAIRIAANDEMGALREILEKSFEKLIPGGRMVVISFHSIEDRIVKHYFRTKQQEGLATVLTKKPITASDEELTINKRSRSAKLRTLEKL